MVRRSHNKGGLPRIAGPARAAGGAAWTQGAQDRLHAGVGRQRAGIVEVEKLSRRQRETSSSRSTWRSTSIVTGAASGAMAARKAALMRVW
jgi:hypothetical protein